jgi:hypothetical protein
MDTARAIRMMRNGLVDSYMVSGPDGVMLTGMTRAWSESFAKDEAQRLGLPYVDETRAARSVAARTHPGGAMGTTVSVNGGSKLPNRPLSMRAKESKTEETYVPDR